MTGKRVLVTGANTGIGKWTAIGLAERGASVVLHARNPEKGRAAQDEIRRQSGSAGRRSAARRLLVARRGAPARRRGARALRPAGRPGQQRGPDLRAPRRERRWLRAHVRGQPSRSVPAHQSAARPHRGVGAGADRHGVVARAPARRRSTSTTSTCVAATRRWTPTGAPSSPTCCSRASWRAGSKAPASPPTACIRAWCAPTSARAATSAGSWASGWAVMQPFLLSPKQGADTSIYLASSPDVAAISGEYFDRRRVARTSTRARDMAAAAAVVAGERGAGGARAAVAT